MNDNKQACSNCRYATKDYTGVAWGLCANSISNMFTAGVSKETWCFHWAPMTLANAVCEKAAVNYNRTISSVLGDDANERG